MVFQLKGPDLPVIRVSLIACIVIVTLIQFSLVGSGFMSITDEFRYAYSGKAIDYLLEGEIGTAIGQLFLAEGRPAEVLIRMIPHAFQTASSKIFGLEVYESANSYPVFIFNFVIYCLILLVHYKASRLILRDNILALFSVLLYCVLTNTYMYVRHALPYDISLLIFYLAFYFVARDTGTASMTYTRAFYLGLLTFLGYMVYPGYFVLLVAVALFFTLHNLTKEKMAKVLRLSVAYGLGCFSCLSAFEITARLVRTSYLVDAMALSNTIKSGSFDESYTFLFKYLLEVEKFSGVNCRVTSFYPGCNLFVAYR